MAALPAEFACEWGLIRVGRFSPIRSYDDWGNCFSLLPFDVNGWQYALDVETRQHDKDNRVESALGMEGLSRWVEIEVVAKLMDTPAHLVFRQVVRCGLPAILCTHGIEIRRLTTSHHWLAVGRRAKIDDPTHGY
jgi:hypothetical protein